MAWYDFFLSKGTQSQELTRYISAIAYALIFVGALIFLIVLMRKTKHDKTDIAAYKTIRLIFVGVLVAVSILSFENFIVLFTPYSVEGNPSMLITILGYTIILYALNLFLLLTVKFRKNIKRIITLLASLEVSLIVIIDLIIAVSIFYELPMIIQDFSVIILGAVVIIVVIFTIINIAIEMRKTANKLTRIKLAAVVVGIIGFLLDGLANMINLFLTAVIGTTPFRTIYITYIVPIFAIFFYGMLLIGFYFSMYPPESLQRRSGILPPSFTDIMKVQGKTDN
jgi:hypothetical protein